MEKTRSEIGLYRSVRFGVSGDERSYLRKKWGNKWKLGTRRKAGKVTRLKTPKVSRHPKMAEERSEDRGYSLSALAFLYRERWPYFIVQDPLDHDQTPCHD